MDIILGATGHVGSVVSKELLERGEDLTLVTHDFNKVNSFDPRATVAVVDVHDTRRLSQLFQTGSKLFFLNPPADPAFDTVKEEKITVYSILEALKNSGVRHVVAESTYGAQPGDGIGDLGVLYEMEEGIRSLGIKFNIIRAAYYMSNWDVFLQTARSTGEIQSFYPAEMKLPMVAPKDLGHFAAELLSSEGDREETIYVEGPERYSANDVAEAFGRALGRTVKVTVIDEGSWLPWLLKMGWSQAAAESMVRMTEITKYERYDKPSNFIRGTTTLDDYIRELVQSA